jgi:hypothetical protein
VDVTEVECIESYAIRSGLAPQSVEELRLKFPRMVRYMHEQGVTQIPVSPLTADARASSLLSLIIRQASKERNASIEHDLRNLTRIRPYKI